MKNQITIACLGDSITKGRFSYDWIKQLKNEFSTTAKFLNLGKDGELAFNALNRLDTVIASNPDHVFVLVGTNDVYSLMSEANTKRYMKQLKLPQIPDIDWFTSNMEQIIVKLKIFTSAQITITSLPVLGEDLKHIANLTVDKYNAEISRLCKKHEVGFLNLNFHMKEILNRTHAQSLLPLQSGLGIIFKSAIRKYLLFQDWDTISERNGMIVTTDGIHLNSISGKMLAKLVKDHIAKPTSN